MLPAADLGVDIEYVETSWPTLMEDTLAGKFDLAICGITVTDSRKEQALMSDGYLENGKTVLCCPDPPSARLAAPLIHEPFTNGELWVLMPKGSEDLLDYVNDFLAKEKRSGRIDDLAEEYFFKYVEDDVLEPAA